MDFPIVTKLCPQSRYSIKCPHYRGAPTRIVIHNTANDAPAENEVSYMINRPDKVSFHYAVDDKKAVQGLPLDRGAFASGDGGTGTGNLRGVHIEICYSLSGGPKFIQAEKNAAQLAANLMKQYNIGINMLTKHQDYDGKYCPHRTLDMGWSRFVDMVRKELEEEDLTRDETIKLINEILENRGQQATSKWAEPAVAEAKKLGIMSGDANGQFRPRSFVTREELAQVAVNLAKKQ